MLFLTLCFVCGHRSLAKDGVLPGVVKSFLIKRTAEVRLKKSRSRVRREKARGSDVRSSNARPVLPVSQGFSKAGEEGTIARVLLSCSLRSGSKRSLSGQ